MKNKRESIQSLLEKYLNGNHTIIQIYDIIVKKLNVPRPTVRREARVLRIKYQERLNILSQNKPKIKKPKQSDSITPKLPPYYLPPYYLPIDSIQKNKKEWYQK